MLPLLLDCVHIILFGSKPRYICIIKAAAACCLVTTTQEKATKCIALLTSFLYFGFLTFGFIFKVSAHNATCVYLPLKYCLCSKECRSQFLLKATFSLLAVSVTLVRKASENAIKHTVLSITVLFRNSEESYHIHISNEPYWSSYLRPPSFFFIQTQVRFAGALLEQMEMQKLFVVVSVNNYRRFINYDDFHF